MCECLKETAKKASEMYVAKIEENYTVANWIDKGAFAHKSFSFNGGPSKIAMPFIFQYIKQKKNGEPERNVTTNTINIYPTFCPFCGKKYPEEK